ncbi:MAG: agmatinase [Phycisphaerales bacterium]|nr:agmatinase [Phycisphaerales bacterium]
MSIFLDIPDEFSNPDTASVCIIPVPYDLTSTYQKGSDHGPSAIIEASSQVEWFDIQTHSEPHQKGIHTQEPIHCDDADPIHLAPMVNARVGEAMDRGQIPVVLGGEHSVSIGAFEAAASRHESLTIVQIDAHADTRECYMGSTHNHACVMARAREFAPIIQIGIRSMDRSELDSTDPDRIYYAHSILAAPNDLWMERVIGQLTSHVYLTIDLDAFDPSIIPSTGTPEPGGLDWQTVNRLIQLIARSSHIVGFDVVELCPNPAHHASDFTAAKLVHRTIAECLASGDRSQPSEG